MLNLDVPVYGQCSADVAAAELQLLLERASTVAAVDVLWDYVQRNRGVLAEQGAQLWRTVQQRRRALDIQGGWR